MIDEWLIKWPCHFFQFVILKLTVSYHYLSWVLHSRTMLLILLPLLAGYVSGENYTCQCGLIYPEQFDDGIFVPLEWIGVDINPEMSDRNEDVPNQCRNRFHTFFFYHYGTFTLLMVAGREIRGRGEGTHDTSEGAWNILGSAQGGDALPGVHFDTYGSCLNMIGIYLTFGCLTHTNFGPTNQKWWLMPISTTD